MTSPKLEKMLANRRTEEEARQDKRKNCKRCGGRGFVVKLSMTTGKIRDFDCPVCNKEDSDAS